MSVAAPERALCPNHSSSIAAGTANYACRDGRAMILRPYHSGLLIGRIPTMVEAQDARPARGRASRWSSSRTRWRSVASSPEPVPSWAAGPSPFLTLSRTPMIVDHHTPAPCRPGAL